MPQPSSLWRNRDFMRLWTADTVSVFGSMVSRIALPFTAILALDAGAFEVSMLVLADLVPSFLVGLPVGVWVDRLRRLPLMVASDLLRALVLLSVPLAALLDALTLGQLYVVAFLASALTVLFNVAQVSVLPSIVPRQDLLEANSKTAATQSISEVGAFGAGGWLVQLLSGPGAIFIDAVSFVVSAVLLRGVRVQEPAVIPEERPGMRAEITEGLRLVARQPILRALTCASMALWFGFSIFGTVISLYALRDLGFEPGPLAMIFAVGGVSSLLGSLVALPVTRRLGVGPAMIVCLLLAGLSPTVLLLATETNWLAVVCLTVQQLGDGALVIFLVNETSLRQSLAPDRMLGRVNATTDFLRSVARLAGVLLAGLLGVTLGLRATMGVGGGAALAGALLLALSPLRNVRDIDSLVDVPVTP